MKLNWLAEPELSPLFNVLFLFSSGSSSLKVNKNFRIIFHPSQTELIHNIPNSTTPNQTHPYQTKLNYTKLNSSIPNRTQPHQTKLIHTKLDSTTPNQTHPNQTKQSQTIPNPNWLSKFQGERDARFSHHFISEWFQNYKQRFISLRVTLNAYWGGEGETFINGFSILTEFLSLVFNSDWHNWG